MGLSPEGDYAVKITGVRATASRFNSPSPAFDVVLDLQTQDGQTDHFAVELSTEIMDRGKHQGKSRAQALSEDLAELGYGGRLIISEMNAGLTGTICEAHVAPREYNGKTYYDVKWLNPRGGRAEKIADADADAMCAAMLGYQLAPVAAAPVAAAPAPVAAPVAAPAPVAAAPVAQPAPVVDASALPW